jgi:hypothetical protein
MPPNTATAAMLRDIRNEVKYEVLRKESGREPHTLTAAA